MNRIQKLRFEALLQLYGAGIELSLSPEQMHKTSRRQQEDFTEREFLQTCLFWVDQKFVEKLTTPSGEIRFRINAQGMIHFEQSYA